MRSRISKSDLVFGSWRANRGLFYSQTSVHFGPVQVCYGPAWVQTSPEQTSNGSAAWTFKTDSTGPDTDSDRLRFGLSIGPATGSIKSVPERWTSPLDFKMKVRAERVFDSDKVWHGLFLLSADFIFFTESDSLPRTRSRVSESAQKW